MDRRTPEPKTGKTADNIEVWKNAVKAFRFGDPSVNWERADCLEKAIRVKVPDILYIKNTAGRKLSKKEATIPADFSICLNTVTPDINAQKTLQAAVFHQLIKKHRNRAMHVDAFEYDSDRIKAAIPGYLRLLEEVVKMAKNK